MKRFLYLAVILSALSQQSVALDKVIHMASLEWPPYTGANLPDQGETIKHAKAIFASMGYTLKVDFFPWARVVNLGLGDKTKYVGYLPEYFDQSLAEKCEFSASVGFSPLGFAQLKSNAVKWRNLNDIAKLKGVGVVRDYLNSPDLDARIASGNIRADLAVSDIENIKKLGANRIPLIVIDQNVFNYWLDNNSELMGLKHIMEMNPRMLDKKNLYLCFKKDEKSSEIRDIFNKGLNAQRMK